MRDIIYQVYPRSFKDANADGVGDLKGILEKVDYIASLGCDYVWISPFFKSPMKDYGYDVSDFRTVDPSFGTNDDIYKLIAACKKRGMKLMVDFVAAHTSNEHPWFTESRQSRDNPKADWYVWRDPKPDGSPPNNWISVFGGSAWQWEPKRQQYYLRQFLVEQPCLNHYSRGVHKALLGEMEFWLKKGVRGFRLDAIQHAHYDKKFRDNPPRPGAAERRPANIYAYQTYRYNIGMPDGLPIIRDMRKLADKYPGTLLLGEVLNRDMARAYTSDTLLHTCYFGDLTHLKKLDPAHIKSLLATIFAQFPKGDFCWSLSNHDFARHVSRLEPDPKFAKSFALLTATLFMTLPGGYCLYQGEELGLPKATLTFDQLVDPFDRSLYPFHKQRDTARTPMPWKHKAPQAGFSTSKKTWLPVDPAQARMAVDTQDKDKSSVLNSIRALIAWRREHLTDTMKYKPLDLPDGLIGFTLKEGKTTWRFAFNLTPKQRKCAGFANLSKAGISHGEIKGDQAILPPYGFIVCR